MIFTQIILGAFVSGLDAGKIYQTWPLMGNSYIPNDLIMVNKNELINFNNHSLVQFYHRNLAYIIIGLILIIGLFIFTKKQKKIISILFLCFVFSFSSSCFRNFYAN